MATVFLALETFCLEASGIHGRNPRVYYWYQTVERRVVAVLFLLFLKNGISHLTFSISLNIPGKSCHHICFSCLQLVIDCSNSIVWALVHRNKPTSHSRLKIDSLLIFSCWFCSKLFLVSFPFSPATNTTSISLIDIITISAIWYFAARTHYSRSLTDVALVVIVLIAGSKVSNM